ncbi:MAG TPA: VCBS repeat-containing protein, partial [Planctomycetota bacterium]|nr:VCBS repeat-containing protein [Planctomycetota bacterium]
CYDVTTRTRPWEISVFGDIGSFALADVAGDARPEVLWGDGQGWEVHGVDVRTRLEVWAIQPGSGGIAGIAVGDLDGDGHPEVATASRGNSAGPGSVVVSDAVTQQSEWTNPMIYGATVAVAVGDVDDDGVDELVVLALGGTVPWYYGGSLSVFDHATGALRWRAPAAGIGNVSPNGLAIGDADGDGDSDIVVGGGSSPACLLVFSGATGALLHDWWPALHPIQRVVILPGTGSQRVLVRTSTGLARMDGATGAVLWQSPLIIAAGVPNLVAGDVTGDGICDAVTTGDGVYLFDGATGLMHDPERVEPSETLTLADLSGDGRLDIVLGSAIGITVLDGPDRAVLRRLDRLAAYPRALSVRDVSGDGVAEIVYAGSDDAVHVIRSSTGSELWRSGFVGAALGGNNALHVDDRDGDGDVEIHVGYDNGVVRIVGALVFTNG